MKPIDHDKNILEEIGLTDGEIKVYLYLLKFGTKKAGEISKHTKLDRSNIYRIIKRLKEKNLVFSSKLNKVKHFSVTRPERIKELYQKKLNKLKEKEDNINDFIKKANKISEVSVPENEFSVEIYEGKREMKNVLESILNLEKGDTVHAFGYEDLFEKTFYYWWKKFIKRRVKKGIFFKGVFKWHGGASSANSKLTKVRYAKFKEMGEILIAFSNNKIWVFNFDFKNDKPKVIFIRSPIIVQGLKNYFKMIWENSEVP